MNSMNRALKRFLEWLWLRNTPKREISPVPLQGIRFIKSDSMPHGTAMVSPDIYDQIKKLSNEKESS